MAKLPSYAKSLLLHGASQIGNFTQGYYFVEERLYTKDAAELLKFCQWIDREIGGAAFGNIDMLYAAFRNPTNAELAAQAEALAEKIRYIRGL